MVKFLNIIQNIKIEEMVDLAVISLIIYFGLIWLKKARARLILVGMVIVALAYFVARIFRLYLTTMIFQAFFAIFFIVIVIIFQDEFRYLFERIATWGMARRRQRVASSNQNADIISNAVANLARKKIGALIVIRGNDLLDRYLEVGTDLDGLLSQVALEAIFDPSAPSHDGAVIIDGNRITKFSCHLPLSIDVREIGRLGTRHAAALGLAERTDALCIVVSEEKGTISVAENDRIRQLDNPEQLHAGLENYYRKKFLRPKRSSVLDFITGHWIEKIIAVVLASSIWLAFGYRMESIRRDFVVPVEYRNLAFDRIIGEPKPKEVVVTLSGIERTFDLINPKELKLSIDMSDAQDGQNSYILTKDMLKCPTDLSVVNIDPDSINLVINRMVATNAPVDVKTKGHIPAGLVLREIRVEPKEIPVVVPSTFAKERAVITTEEIDLKSINDTVSLNPKFTIPAEVKLVGEKLPEVRVTIVVEKKEGAS